MKRFERMLVAGVAAATLVMAGCGGGATPKPSSGAPATTAPAAAAPAPKPSPAAPLPSYTDVLKTFPPTAKMCRTVVYLVDVGNSNIMSLSVHPKGTDPFQRGPKDRTIRCTGTQISVLKDVRLEEKRYKRGARLTVDKNNNWVEVSGWN